jgi:hypothetical protein
LHPAGFVDRYEPPAGGVGRDLGDRRFVPDGPQKFFRRHVPNVDRTPFRRQEPGSIARNRQLKCGRPHGGVQGIRQKPIDDIPQFDPPRIAGDGDDALVQERQ